MPESHAILRNLPIGVVMFDMALRIRYANKAGLEIIGAPAEETIGKHAADLKWSMTDTAGNPLPPEQYPAMLVHETGRPLDNFECGLLRPGSEDPVWLLCNGFVQYDEEGEQSGVVVCLTDITDRKEAIPFKDIVEEAHDIVLVTRASPLRNGGPEIVYANKSFYRTTHFHEGEIIGRTPRILQGSETDPEVKQRIFETLSRGEPVREEIVNYTKTGVPYWIDLNIFPLFDDAGRLRYFAAIERDITLSKTTQLELSKQAFQDPLTKLLNRRGLETAIATLNSVESMQGREITLALLDADHFKSINDNHGHDVGDEALKHLASCIRQHVREGDIVARLGGEEFCAVLCGIPHDKSLEKLESLRRLIAGFPLPTAAGTLHVTVSIGAVSARLEGSLAFDELSRLADRALYESKGAGRNRTTLTQSPLR